jgi:hypothetical protein
MAWSIICGYAILFFSLTAAASPADDLRGVVTDSNGAVIRSAQILIHWDKSGTAVGLKSNVGLTKDMVLQADRNGKFGADLPLGFYDLFVSADAFSPQCQKIRITSGVTTFDPKLHADPIVTNELGDSFR